MNDICREKLLWKTNFCEICDKAMCSSCKQSPKTPSEYLDLTDLIIQAVYNSASWAELFDDFEKKHECNGGRSGYQMLTIL